METLIAPYGAAGWERRKALFSGIIKERAAPPFIFRDVLILVSSARQRRTYGRLFLDLAQEILDTASIVQPEIQTMHRFLLGLGEQHQERRLIDENSRLVLIEGIVKEAIAGSALFGMHPEVIAPSLSASMAEMIGELTSAGVGPDRLAAAVRESDWGDKPQIALLARVFTRYEEALADKGLIDPAGLLAFLGDHLDPSWLDPWSRIIIDGLHMVNDLEARVLRKIASAGSCSFIIDAPSADLVRNAGEYHPLTLTREFLARLGLSAGRAEASPEGDEHLLGQMLFSSKTFEEAAAKAPPASSFNRDLRLLSAVSMREEAALIAGEVKKALRRGTRPDAILVAFPSLDDYGQLVEEIFRDHGIPYNRALGRQLSASPIATALVSLLKAVQDDHAGPSLLRVLGSPFLRFGADHALAPALDRLMRYGRIMGGRERLLAAAKRLSGNDGGKDILSRPLTELFSALEPFGTREPAPLSRWMDRLAELMAWSGITSRVDEIKGPLNVNLQAWRKLLETIASLRAAGTRFPEYRYTFNEWFFLLRKTFMQTRFQVPPEDEAGVQILGIEESTGRAWDEVFLGGLVDGKFPQRLPQNIFLPEATLEQLGVRTLEKARLNAAYHFYRLLLTAPRVTLTWPEQQGDKPVVPSPFLQELEPLRIARLLNRGIKEKDTHGIQFSLAIQESRSIPELARSLSLAGRVEGLAEVLAADIVGMEGIRTALAFEPQPPETSVTPPLKRVFRVTELDDYLACPYDYYVKHVLGIAPLEEVTEDISPLARGSKVHAILRDFYEEWKEPITTGNEDRARELLRTLAERAFRHEADTFRNRREKERFLTVMAERFLEAEKEFWTTGFRPALLEEKIESFVLRLPDGREVDVHAKIDRIDVDGQGNFIIVDYKTGAYPLPKTGVEQEIFQLPAYAVIAQQTMKHAAPLRNPVGLAYYDLAGKNKGLARDMVLFNEELLQDQPAAKPKASPKSAGEFEEILRRSMDRARAAVEGILAGDFMARPQDEKKCRYCPNETMCRREA